MNIELRSLSKKFGHVTALNDIHLKVEDGEFVTLLGPSGCGKTTLLRIIAGFVRPTEGEVLLGGEDITNLPPNQRQVGMLFQNYALFTHMTVEDNVSFGLRMRGAPKEEVRRKVSEMLELVGMQEFGKRYPGQLSGGQQQRVALARTLATEPRVLLLDEPLAALDRQLRLQMQVELKKLIDRIGITTVCVTHDQDEALTMSDRIALMNRSVIEQYGRPMEIYDHPKTSFAASFVGNSNLFTGALRFEEGGAFFESGQLRIRLPSLPEDLPKENVTLLLRPQYLSLTTGAGDQHSVPGTVTFVTQLGGATQYEVQLADGRTVMVQTGRTREDFYYAPKEQVHVGFADPSAYYLFEDGKPEGSVSG